MGASGHSARPGFTAGYARAARYRRVREQVRRTAAAIDPGPEAAIARTAALVPSLWDRAALPLGLRAWQQYEPRDAHVALRRLCRFEVRELVQGADGYLSRWTRDVSCRAIRLVDGAPTPLGWMFFMERPDATDDPFPRAPLER